MWEFDEWLGVPDTVKNRSNFPTGPKVVPDR